MPQLLDTLLLELRRFFEPLGIALASPQELAAFLRRFGYDFGSTQLGTAANQLAPLRSAVLQLSATTRTALANGLDAADLISIGNAAAPLFQGLSSFGTSLGALQPPAGLSAQQFTQALATLAEELFDTLLGDYLGERSPLTLHALAFLDVVGSERIPASGDPRSRGLAYSLPIYRWDRIGLVFDDPRAWAEQSYGWGVAFDSDKFIVKLARVLEYIGGMAEVRDMSEPQAAVFMPHLAQAPIKPHIAVAPIVRLHGVDSSAAGSFDVSNEFGIALLPIAGKTPATLRSDAGLAIAPYTEGAVASTLPLSESAELQLKGQLGAVGGVVFSLRPSGPGIDLGVDATAFSGTFSADLKLKPPPGSNTIIFIGEPGSTRVEAEAAVASLGGNASNTDADLFVAAGLHKLRVVIDGSGDGLLGSLISSPIEAEAGDLAFGWRSGRGVYFEGGDSISIKVPVDKQFGPIHLYELGIAVDWSDAVSVTGAVTADARLGPLYLYVEGLGLIVSLVPNDNGTFGRFDLGFGLKLPTGYAVALDAAPIEGGGYLSVRDAEYRGALALKFETFGFSAFAILNTKLPGGRPGFSFVASIFGDFVLPLGYGFFLTGLGGVIGIHRTVNTEALREVLYEGQLDSILFPADPIANAATILDNMAAIFPAREGQFVFGPMAKIAFSQPALIEGKLGVVLELGQSTRILILGAVGTHLPSRDAALVVLEVSFFGEIDCAAGTISFDGTLQNSRILSWSVSGDMAVRTGWAPRIDHVVSFGGLHPRYPRPANLPDLRRMSINFGSNNPRVSLWSYQALTLNSLQFGAGGDMYAKGPKIWLVGRLAAEGHAYFDALIYFNPFAFDAQLGGSLSLLIDGDVVAGLGFDLRLTGPNNFAIDGRVWVTVFGLDLGFGIHHEWGDRRTLAASLADPVTLLRDAISAAPELEPVAASALAEGVRFATPRPGEPERRAASPVGGLRFSQRALPLGVAIEKVGEAQIAGSARTFELAVFEGSTAAELKPAELDFVQGHFWNTSEAERLRAPAFARHKSGFEITSGDALRFDPARAIDVEYGYEFVVIGDEADGAASPLHPFATVLQAPIAERMLAQQRAFAAPLDPVALIVPANDAPAIAPGAFSVLLDPAAGAPPSSSSLQALRASTVPHKRNPIVADYLLPRGA